MKAKITVNGKTYVGDNIVCANGIVSIDGMIQNGYCDIPSSDLNSDSKFGKLIGQIIGLIWILWVTFSLL
jgi:hypothetical protein